MMGTGSPLSHYNFSTKREKMELKKAKSKKKEINIKDIATYEATAQMLAKARRDNIEAVFDRATNMKARPIGGIHPAVNTAPLGSAENLTRSFVL
jgi:hypothetical protein